MTSYTALKGCGCKVPQVTLQKYLSNIGDGTIGKETPDCSVIKYPDTRRCLVSTTDFFYPLVDDPYTQGEIACANVLSDLYAMGISRCDHMLMILGVCLDMTPAEQEVSTREMIRGFNDKAAEAGTVITGGQSVFNDFPMIGGVANTVIRDEEIVYPRKAREGDVLVLTKALGSRVVVNAYKWYKSKGERWEKVKGLISEEDMGRAYDICCGEMTSLNKSAAELMAKYKVHGGTDVTGFGILGHARNLAEAQERDVDLRIHTLPVIHRMLRIHDKVVNYKLTEGFAAETSGGILMIVPSESVDQLLKDFKQMESKEAWIVGEVMKGEKKAYIEKDFKTIEVS
eukprot:TRINITY_DN6191_c0_g1_i18.p1 TRINITY_DN6191_c0_g1~~TRINITY_DN6191_c0_g1_i18.p1  ORF type:complete len:342 (-),score=96.92 TRINITY_DN6191_c0_g1_i18:106-1131(-)